MIIKCSICEEEKDSSFFYKNKESPFGVRSDCKICFSRHAKLRRENNIANPSKIKYKICSQCKKMKSVKDFDKQLSLQDGFRSNCKECRLEDRRNNIQKYLFKTARARAKKNNDFFNLVVDDVIIPGFCPILNIPLFIEGKVQTNNSPSIDRIDNSKGYIKGNIIVISYKANRIKNNATVDELEKVYLFYKNLSEKKD